MKHWPTLLLRRFGLSSFAVVVSLVLSVLAAFAVVGINEIGYRRSADAVSHVALYDRSRLALHSLLQSLLDAETSERGYLMTGDRAYLAPYRQATHLIEQQLSGTRELFLQAQLPGAELDALATTVRRKLGEMEDGLRLRDSGRENVWKLALGDDIGNELMRDIRQRIAALIEQNSAEIEQRREDIMRSLRVARVGIGLTSVIALLAFFQSLRQAHALAAVNLRRKEELERERDLLDRLVKKRTARLAELATHLQNVREDERAHLARELHDELGSLLTAAKLDVARLKSKIAAGDVRDLQQRLLHLTETLNSGIALKRRIIETLRPSSLTNLGLTASLAILTREFAEQAEVRVQTQIDEVVLGDAAQLTVYRLVQESLTNIGKYSAAKEVWVTVRDRPQHVQVEVRDNGRGFDPEQIRSGAHGLAGMRHRVEAAGGHLTVASRPNSGTRIAALLPKAPAHA